jgi:DNA polymerase
MALKYPDLRYAGGEFIYSTQKGIVRTYGPRLAENVIQALARIVITDQILEVHALPEVDVVLQVHDEIIALGSEVDSDATMEKIMNIMKTPPSWCSDLPLDAEGGVSQVYDK